VIVTSTLARYIALRFVYTITGAFILCLSLIFLVDFIEVLRSSGKFGGASIWLVVWITLLRLPAFAELTVPFAVLIGTIAAYLLLSRSSELTVMRAAGMSVWQFLVPGLLVAIVVGGAAITLYNPLAADARAKAERVYADAFKRNRSLLKTKAGSWLRQDSIDGQSVLSARATADHGLTLAGLTALQYDTANHFVERIDAGSAKLKDGYWELENAWVSRPREAPGFYRNYLLATHLTRAQVTNALGSVISVSFWRLPGYIKRVEKAGLSASRYKVQYQQLLARPLLLAAMVLLGATVSLGAFRFGGIQGMVITGLVAGFGFFILAEISRQIGVSGLTPPVIAAWVPAAIASFLSLTALLHQEDG